LAAGLRPDPPEELKCSSNPLSAIWGLFLRGKGREGRRLWELRERRERPPNQTFWIRHCMTGVFLI